MVWSFREETNMFELLILSIIVWEKRLGTALEYDHYVVFFENFYSAFHHPSMSTSEYVC